MKLLIVDDEKLTREGLCSSIDWESLGITEVAGADDGLNGIAEAKKNMPDIVLSDVRMPRMDGIRMCAELQKMNPELCIIFMSGYSDKEYLKSAIRLKAVRYVEKPIEEEEVAEAVREAVRLVSSALVNKEKEQKSAQRETEILAEKLCQPGRVTEEELKRFVQTNPEKPCAFSLLIKIYHQSALSSTVFSTLNGIVSASAQRHYMKCIGCDRQNAVYVFHIYQISGYTDAEKKALGAEISEELMKHTVHFHIVFGKNTEGLMNVYGSYSSAVIELQNCFFSERQEVRVYSSADSDSIFPAIPEDEDEKSFRKALLGGEKDILSDLIEKKRKNILSGRGLLPNQVRDLYYRSFQAVSETESLLGMKGISNAAGDSNWGVVSSCESIFELDEQLKNRVGCFLSMLEKRSETHAAVAMIKEYIANSYTNELLSIKDISEHVLFSTSYVCTLFKNETGQTLNQYITDYRIEKAKELLLDHRNRIGDISKEVGYADSNYFGKIFKKQVGMTPSEFREKTGF
ncbi:MAG: response regulator [Eubacterium sp.]|nr:response regulator [Eubacterium sp.]